MEAERGCFQGLGHTGSVQWGGSVNVWHSGLWRRSLSGKFLIEVSQDLADDGRLVDESDDAHLGATLPTGQRVDLVDPVDELGPAFSKSASGRGRLVLHISFATRASTAAHCPNAIGVGSRIVSSTRGRPGPRRWLPSYFFANSSLYQRNKVSGVTRSAISFRPSLPAYSGATRSPIPT